jgi:AbrB family looped-hinge helix DNA binding protein
LLSGHRELGKWDVVGYSYQRKIEHARNPACEYVVNTRIGEKGQLTIPKKYRDDLGLDSGAPVAILRIGEGLMLIPERSRFRLLCDAVASVFEERKITPANLLETLPQARERVFARRYSAVSAKEGGAARRRSKV